MAKFELCKSCQASIKNNRLTMLCKECDDKVRPQVIIMANKEGGFKNAKKNNFDDLFQPLTMEATIQFYDIEIIIQPYGPQLVKPKLLQCPKCYEIQPPHVKMLPNGICQLCIQKEWRE